MIEGLVGVVVYSGFSLRISAALIADSMERDPEHMPRYILMASR
jgi:hypothetical protein